MKLFHCILSIPILILYGLTLFFLFSPIDLNDYSLSESEILPEYDYIVVGAGSAGSVIASRLAENNLNVLLLESGVSDAIDVVKMPIGWLSIVSQKEYQYLDWGNSATFKKGTINKKIPFPRAKLAGGCGSINANIWNMGSHNIYDKWEEMGAKGWKYADIKKYFALAENTLWIQEESGRFIHKSMRDLIDVASQIYEPSEGFNIKSKGFGVYETTTRNGRRWSSSDAYLKPALRKYGDNLHLRLNATVDKLLFNNQNTRATGVLLDNGRVIKAKKEIIVSAGAFNSPLLLMRSGIGNSSELKKFGIKPIKELPGVGQNLQTHPTTSFNLRTNETQWDFIKEEPPSLSKILDYLIFGTGAYSSNVAEVGGYYKTKYSQFPNIEDIQVHCGPLLFVVPELIKEMEKYDRNGNFLGCALTLVTARDKGSIHLRSIDAKDPAEININYFKYEEDLNSMLEGFELMRKIFESSAFKGKAEFYFPDKEELENKEKLINYIYKSLFEVYHPTGTCKMGDVEKDSLAVVDHKLKVKGFENLRVIDASVMPEITNSNTNAPTIMIAEKGAEMIINRD